jgi:hypothetical protein
MRDEVLFRGETTQIRPVFGENNLYGFHADSIDLGQIHSAHPIPGFTHRLLPSSSQRSPFHRISGRGHRFSAEFFLLHVRQFAENLLLVIGDPVLDGVKHLQSDDRKAYLKPWTVTQTMHLLADTDLLEFVCGENEKDLKHLPAK